MKRSIEIASGEEWLGFVCVNHLCGMPILVSKIRPEQLDASGTLRLRGEAQQLKCPYCQNVSVYPIEEAKRFLANDTARH